MTLGSNISTLASKVSSKISSALSTKTGKTVGKAVAVGTGAGVAIGGGSYIALTGASKGINNFNKETGLGGIVKLVTGDEESSNGFGTLIGIAILVGLVFFAVKVVLPAVKKTGNNKNNG